MAGLIYKRFLNHQWKEDWENLSQAERDAYLEKYDQVLHTVGGKRLVVIECDSAYALKEWKTFGVEVFLDEDSVQKYQQLLDELGWSRFVETEIATNPELSTGLEECMRA